MNPLMSRSPLSLYPPCLMPSFPPSASYYSSCLINPSLVCSVCLHVCPFYQDIDPCTRAIQGARCPDLCFRVVSVSLSDIIFRINRIMGFASSFPLPLSLCLSPPSLTGVSCNSHIIQLSVLRIIQLAVRKFGQ